MPGGLLLLRLDQAGRIAETDDPIDLDDDFAGRSLR
jgi:hypothetical protein